MFDVLFVALTVGAFVLLTLLTGLIDRRWGR